MNIPVSPSASFKRLNPTLYAQNLETHSVASNSEPECAVSHDALGPAQGETQDAGRAFVFITSFRRRLLDTDNLVGKYVVDSLRYAGLIFDDSPDQITLTVRQRKVAHKGEERTEVTIEYP